MIVIVPTRKRPQNIADLIEACAETITDPRTFIRVVVDGEDDPDIADEYQRIFDESPHPFWSMQFSPRRRLGPTLNIVSAVWAYTRGACGFMGDDHRPRTKGWDEKISNHISDNPLSVVYGNDLVQGESLPTAAFMCSTLISRLGYMVPPTITHLYVDNFWRVLGERLGTLTYFEDVIIEHLHPSAGTAEMDVSYEESNSKERYDADEAAYVAYVRDELDLAVRLVRRGTVRP